MTARLRVRFAAACPADRLWSAGAMLPLSVGEAMLRPQAARSMAARRKGASMAYALQKFVGPRTQALPGCVLWLGRLCLTR